MGDVVFYAQIYGIAFLICMIVLHSLTRRRAGKYTIEQKLFIALTIHIACVLAFDLIGWAVDGKNFPGGIMIYYVSQSLFYIASAGVLFVWILYVVYKMYRTREAIVKRLVPNIILTAIYLILALTTPATHLIYYIDEFNVYHRGPLFVSLMFFVFIMAIWGLVEVIAFSRKYKGLYSFYTYLQLNLIPLVIIACTIIQIGIYGLAIIWPGCAVAITFIYSSMQVDERSIDPLTNLKNRSDMFYYIQFKTKSRKPNNHLFLLYLDLSSFKNINDTFGHLIGDDALINASMILKESCQLFDDTVFRIGGDEFALIGERSSKEDVDRLMKIIQLNCDLNNLKLEQYSINFDMGVSYYNPEKGIKAWIEEADTAMYAQKRNRKEQSLNK